MQILVGDKAGFLIRNHLVTVEDFHKIQWPMHYIPSGKLRYSHGWIINSNSAIFSMLSYQRVYPRYVPPGVPPPAGGTHSTEFEAKCAEYGQGAETLVHQGPPLSQSAQEVMKKRGDQGAPPVYHKGSTDV